jgi:hypothetical protein
MPPRSGSQLLPHPLVTPRHPGTEPARITITFISDDSNSGAGFIADITSLGDCDVAPVVNCVSFYSANLLSSADAEESGTCLPSAQTITTVCRGEPYRDLIATRAQALIEDDAALAAVSASP